MYSLKLGEMNKEEFDFGLGNLNNAYREYFTGNSYLNPIAKTENVLLEPDIINWNKVKN